MKPYYEADGITIYHGDCREVLPSLRADVVITDPPYGVNLGFHHGAAECRAGNLVKGPYLSYEDTPENFDAVVVPGIAAAVEMTTRGLVFCAAHQVWKLPQAATIGGIYLPAGCGRNRWGYTSFALCLMYGQAPELHKGAKPTGIRSTAVSEPNDHPCPKPLAWMKWAVNLATVPDDLVLDPFCGSGTTLRAAKDLGRKAIGIEIEERYCEIAADRLAQRVLAI